MRCKICGAECSDDMLFCKDCGSPLKTSPSAAKVPEWDVEEETEALEVPPRRPQRNTYAEQDQSRQQYQESGSRSQQRYQETDGSSRKRHPENAGRTQQKHSEKKSRSRASKSAPEYVPVQSNPNTIPEDYKPISMWGYFGYELLFAIPLVGFILILVFSFGGTRNKNLKNFARSFFCVWIIAVVLIVILLMTGFFGAAGLRASYLSSQL